ncbi:hypothetical protein KVH24_27005 [Streptomyces olivaceus]|uniref:hypothetical protein n=1 Tax=Streptomyces olivaceus TaxID=47716 RepID=UPI001CCC07BD|nr:hypothetical protein [Streptomyces olivaceus]MBZ6176176.1 hypothetical protein [Streptomyces olivaceus]MBZ6182624.1 hypothetical protein [Streptomyces olivaceus]
MFRIGSGDRYAELVEGDRRRGGPRLVLGRTAPESGSRLDIALDDLFVASAGRPWRPVRPGVRTCAPERSADGLRARCTLTGLPGLEVRLALGFTDGLLRLRTTWRNTGHTGLADAVLGIALPLPARAPEAVTLPQVLYRGNPSADPARTVPRLAADPGGGLVVEEHRLPVPCAHAEWTTNREPRYATLYATRPGTGSLGAVRGSAGVTLLGLSGALLFNGRPDTAYVHKGRTAPHDAGYLDLPPGGEFQGHHALDWGRPSRPGHGFRELVHRGLALYRPRGAAPLTLDGIVRLKTAALDRRWHDASGAAGYLKFTGPGHTPGFMYGWTGQCLRLAWCDARIGVEHAEPWRVERCRRAVNFYLAHSTAPLAPGLRLSFYATEDGAWTGFTDAAEGPFVSARALGDTLGDLADVVLLLRRHGHAVPHGWVRALVDGVRAACAEGPPPFGWRTDGTPLASEPGTAGLPCVLAMLKAFRVTGERELLRTAEAFLEEYHERFADDYATPFARATLDAACEDKEGGMAYFLCAFELLRLTGKKRWQTRAQEAADWLLTWVYQWNPPFGNGFATTGWPGVSVQNHHVDVFFPAYELARLGDLVDRPVYRELGELVLHAFGQGICTRPGEWDFDAPGEQAEGFFPTNWQERGTSNTWNPSWVTAQVLSQALRMRAGRRTGQPASAGAGAGSGRWTPRGR